MAKGKSRVEIGLPKDRQIDQRLIENLYIEVEGYLNQEKPEKALEVLEKAPQQILNLPEFLYLRGTAYGMLEEYHLAVEDLELAVQRSHGAGEMYFGLMVAYSGLEFRELAWEAAEKFLKKSSGIGDEGKEVARMMIAQYQEDITKIAARLKLPLEKFRHAIRSNEQAELLIASGKFKQSSREAENAIRIAPNWAAPRNNRALSLYYQGQIERAIAEEQAVLDKIDNQNIHALGNLILFYSSSWQREKATSYSERLRDVLINSPSYQELDLSKAIESLGIWEDDETLWDLAGRLMDESPDSLSEWDWYILRAAAANTGHLEAAKKLLERAKKISQEDEHWIRPALNAVKKAIRSQKTPEGPCLDERFPYLHFRQFWPRPIAMEFTNESISQKEEENASLYIGKYLSRYPFVAYAARQMLWCEPSGEIRQLAILMLAAANQAGAFEELRRFAFSQYGSDQERLDALERLREAGQLPPGEKIRFWTAKEGRWTEIKIFENQIEDEYYAPCDPEAAKLAEQGRQALMKGQEEPKNQAKAAQLYLKALEIDANCVIALHNLGIVKMLQGKEAEGESLFRRAVEVDPGYLFGYTSLAELELQRKNYEACRENLKKVFSSGKVPANAILRALAIEIRLELAQNNLDLAEKTLDTLKSLAPDHSKIPLLESYIHEAELDIRWRTRWLEDVHRYHKRQLEKPISVDENLAACLGRISREALTATLHFWALTTYGKKAEVIARLVDVMPDPSYSSVMIENKLREEELQALDWVLEAGGKRHWNEFIERYGDDFDESPYWQYHEPETIPGRLRMAGLVSVGTLEGEGVVILIPSDLRQTLVKIKSL